MTGKWSRTRIGFREAGPGIVHDITCREVSVRL